MDGMSIFWQGGDPGSAHICPRVRLPDLHLPYGFVQPARPGSLIGIEFKMKLWDLLAMCFLLLSTVSTSPLFQSLRSDKRLRPLAQALSVPPVLLDDEESESTSETQNEASVRLQERSLQNQHGGSSPDPEQLGYVLDFIKATMRRMRRSTDRGRRSSRGQKRGRQKEGRKHRRWGGNGVRGTKNRGCVLKQIHLNVTDLGLGYQTKEELIFKYCSGPCVTSETNYDRILNNLTQNKRLEPHSPPRACCRPVAFDDDLSFLDDNLVYHTLRRHSAKRCACV
ncbi:glial cell line-derived neurotrophic factor isoform X2 [Paramormyrops kingsleyae]|uniref:Glial cell line-derived neurotrophic factor n=1 Tax=Paramormyrops kingsleyae TaxID=1676925 RepID=A0A3B3T8D2_9TELE|nr:glial cell line-derived neurotrophic factor-like isoform X2 [Paramormyrops kingsleyae]